MYQRFSGADLAALFNDETILKTVRIEATREKVPEFNFSWDFYCWYCETCGVLCRTNSVNIKKHVLRKFKLSREILDSITEGIDIHIETSHGSGWYISKELFEQKLFDAYL